MTSYPNTGFRTLSDAHRRMLFDESGIDPAVAEERGYHTVRRRAELQEFPEWQRRLGIYIPMYSPDGETTGCQIRPNRPRKDLKYESPQGSSVILDVHPRAHGEVRSGAGDLFVVEGVKKADALLSHGAVAVALAGVWMAHVPQSKPKRHLPCWDHVRLSGRRVFIIFDSDWKYNDNVHAALQWLVGALEERGADVRVAHLEDNPDGSKAGADDYLATGGTVAELKALCRKFEVQDVARIRLSKDGKLRAAVEDLQRRWWAEEWKGRGGHTDRDVAWVFIEAASRSGKIHADGLRTRISWGRLQVEAKVSRRTLSKAITRLEERGFLYRDNEGRKVDKTGAFVLRANVDHYGRRATPQGKATKEKVMQALQAFDAGGLHLRALPDVPRLRWSSPKYTLRRGLVSGTRRVRDGKPLPARAGIARLGKIRGAVVDALYVAGGALSLQELCAILHRKRVRDTRRRVLPMLVEAGIIALDGAAVALTTGWSERLEAARRIGGELEADELAERRRKIKSRAYHNRDKASASKPTAASVAAIQRNREARKKGIVEEHQRARRQRAAAAKTEEQRKRERRIRQLVREGMSERWARDAVFGDRHLDFDKSRLSSAALAPNLIAPPSSATRRKLATEVPLVGGIYQHGQECDCEWCAA